MTLLLVDIKSTTTPNRSYIISSALDLPVAAVSSIVSEFLDRQLNLAKAMMSSGISPDVPRTVTHLARVRNLVNYFTFFVGHTA